MRQCNDKGPRFTGVVFLSDDELRRAKMKARALARDYDVFIGIDPGVKTGIAYYYRKEKKLISVSTEKIHKALEAIDFTLKIHNKARILVRIEDARLRKFIQKEKGREVLQGVGSVKRDCQIWEDFLEDRGIDYELLAPAAGRTKWKPDYFTKVTGYTGKTSNHGRDAAALVYGL